MARKGKTVHLPDGHGSREARTAVSSTHGGCEPATSLPRLNLPTDARASLLMPHLSRRFTLLRSNNWHPVSRQALQARLQEHRLTGAITEEDERILLQHFDQHLDSPEGDHFGGPSEAPGAEGIAHVRPRTPSTTSRGGNSLFAGSSSHKDAAYLRKTARSRSHISVFSQLQAKHVEHSGLSLPPAISLAQPPTDHVTDRQTARQLARISRVLDEITRVPVPGVTSTAALGRRPSEHYASAQEDTDSSNDDHSSFHPSELAERELSISPCSSLESLGKALTPSDHNAQQAFSNLIELPELMFVQQTLVDSTKGLAKPSASAFSLGANNRSREASFPGGPLDNCQVSNRRTDSFVETRGADSVGNEVLTQTTLETPTAERDSSPRPRLRAQSHHLRPVNTILLREAEASALAANAALAKSAAFQTGLVPRRKGSKAIRRSQIGAPTLVFATNHALEAEAPTTPQSSGSSPVQPSPRPKKGSFRLNFRRRGHGREESSAPSECSIPSPQVSPASGLGASQLPVQEGYSNTLRLRHKFLKRAMPPSTTVLPPSVLPEEVTVPPPTAPLAVSVKDPRERPAISRPPTLRTDTGSADSVQRLFAECGLRRSASLSSYRSSGAKSSLELRRGSMGGDSSDKPSAAASNASVWLQPPGSPTTRSLKSSRRTSVGYGSLLELYDSEAPASPVEG